MSQNWYYRWQVQKGNAHIYVKCKHCDSHKVKPSNGQLINEKSESVKLLLTPRDVYTNSETNRTVAARTALLCAHCRCIIFAIKSN